jgi:hypothetical protein
MMLSDSVTAVTSSVDVVSLLVCCLVTTYLLEINTAGLNVLNGTVTYTLWLEISMLK